VTQRKLRLTRLGHERAFTDLHALLCDAILIAPMTAHAALMASGHHRADPSLATPAALPNH
jgi:hypothetical protein